MERVTGIELMIVLSIFAIIALIVIDAFQRHLANAKLRTAARQITADFNYYENKAKSEGRLYTIFFNTAAPNSYTISAPATRTLGAVKVTRTLSGGIACIADVNSTGSKSIRLKQRGLLAHYDITLSLQHNSDKNFR